MVDLKKKFLKIEIYLIIILRTGIVTFEDIPRTESFFALAILPSNDIALKWTVWISNIEWFPFDNRAGPPGVVDETLKTII